MLYSRAISCVFGIKILPCQNCVKIVRITVKACTKVKSALEYDIEALRHPSVRFYIIESPHMEKKC